MARELVGIERGLRIFGENSDTGYDIIFGTGAPGSVAQENTAEAGSLYIRTDTFQFYQKDTAGSGTDKWTRSASVDDVASIQWRSEKVKVVTNDTSPSDGATITSFGDDDGGGPNVDNTGFAVNDHIIYDADGTPKLFIVSSVAAGDITVTSVGVSVLVDNDAYVAQFYLPDPVGQEGQALVVYSGGIIVKIGDVNWDLATGINLSSGYTAASGNPVASESIESAMQKLDGNIDALNTLTGTAQGAVNLGTFTGGIITDNTTIKAALQELETNVEGLITRTSATGITTITTLDSVIVDNVRSTQWLVTVTLDSAPANVKSYLIHAGHNGTVSADATIVDDAVLNRLKIGSNFNLTVGVDLNGAAGAQVMRLTITASAAVSASATRFTVE